MRANSWKLIWTIIFFNGLAWPAFGAKVEDPCGGKTALLNIIDRPTVADSACVVPSKKIVLEAGYQYQWLTHSAGNLQNFPEAELRFGLLNNNELAIVLPNYILQSMTSGFSATTIGLKHEIGYTKKWLGAVEALFTLPTGSSAFGSHGLGVALNAIASYTINSKFNLTFMIGVSTQTESSANGGGRFQSFNPDLVFTYSATKKLDFYGEVYGQTKTSPGEGSGFNFDSGFLYLLFSNFVIDAEVGQRLNGNLGGFNHYIGAGFGVMF